MALGKPPPEIEIASMMGGDGGIGLQILDRIALSRGIESHKQFQQHISGNVFLILGRSSGPQAPAHNAANQRVQLLEDGVFEGRVVLDVRNAAQIKLPRTLICARLHSLRMQTSLQGKHEREAEVALRPLSIHSRTQYPPSGEFPARNRVSCEGGIKRALIGIEREDMLATLGVEVWMGRISRSAEKPAAAERFESEAMPHLNDIFRTAIRIIGQRERAEDVAQEVFLRAWRSFGRFERGTNCRAWL